LEGTVASKQGETGGRGGMQRDYWRKRRHRKTGILISFRFHTARAPPQEHRGMNDKDRVRTRELSEQGRCYHGGSGTTPTVIEMTTRVWVHLVPPACFQEMSKNKWGIIPPPPRGDISSSSGSIVYPFSKSQGAGLLTEASAEGAGTHHRLAAMSSSVSTQSPVEEISLPIQRSVELRVRRTASMATPSMPVYSIEETAVQKVVFAFYAPLKS
jgi:hypothetical protein